MPRNNLPKLVIINMINQCYRYEVPGPHNNFVMMYIQSILRKMTESVIN